MRLTTLCYIEKDGKYLMLHRTKKEKDQSHNKWLGIGGKLEIDESPEACMMREVMEETGYQVKDYVFAGVITFLSDLWETEYMFLYVVTDFSGEEIECNEGDLCWIPKHKVMELNLWEGDRIFISKLLRKDYGFSIRYCYEGDRLVEVTGTVTDMEIRLLEQYRSKEKKDTRWNDMLI